MILKAGMDIHRTLTGLYGSRVAKILVLHFESVLYGALYCKKGYSTMCVRLNQYITV